MTALFEQILEMSLTSAVVILVVLVIRLCLRKAPRKYSYALWAVAAFRLVCPVSFRAVFSLFSFAGRVEEAPLVQNTQTTFPDGVLSAPPGTGTPIPVDPDYIYTTPLPAAPADPALTAMTIAAVVWLVGMAALLVYAVVSYVRLRRRMATAVVLEGRVWQSDRVQSPFILGFFRPRIYLPFGLTEDQRRYVLAHENYHLRRLDHLIRPLSYLILAVHWFNPLVWVAYFLMARDMEMSCDEKILSTEGNICRAYSTTLLAFAANRRFPSPSPLAFGESGVKGRIKNALNWKKCRTWVTVAAAVVCVAVIAICAANPKEPATLENRPTPYDWAAYLTPEDVDSAVLSHYDGEWLERSLSTEELHALLAALKQVPEEDFTKTDSDGSWAFPTERMVTLTCGGVDYVLNLGETPMTISCTDGQVDWKGETHWYLNNETVKQFLRDLPGTDSVVLGEGLVIMMEYQLHRSVECLYMSPLSSVAAIEDDNREDWFIGAYRVTIYSNYTGEQLADFTDLPDWEQLTQEKWEAMSQFPTTLPDISGYDKVFLRTLSEDDALVYADGAFWAVELSGGKIWSVWSLGTPVTTVPDGAETLAVWQADLIHGGEEETVTVSAVGKGQYTVTVTRADGVDIWSGLADYAHAGHNGFYLYERDGLQYLLQWQPYLSNGIGSYQYRVFSLSESGAMYPLSSGSFSLDFNDRGILMDTDPAALEAFEAEINALLADSVLLLSTNESEFAYSTPNDPQTLLWTAPTEELATMQQQYRDALARREANTLMTRPFNDLTLKLLKTDDPDAYSLEVYWEDYRYWNSTLRTHPAYGDTIYLIYRENGRDYLAEFNNTSSQGVGMYSYRVYAIDAMDMETVVHYENSLYYEAMSPETVATVDVDAIRAFEAEVNALFRDAEILCGVENGQFFYNADPGSGAVFHWENPDVERILQDQQTLAEQTDGND